jgi:hypothetical protein
VLCILWNKNGESSKGNASLISLQVWRMMFAKLGPYRRLGPIDKARALGLTAPRDVSCGDEEQQVFGFDLQSALL